MTGLEAILVEVDLTWTSQVALMLKNLSANQEILETQVLSLGCASPQRQVTRYGVRDSPGERTKRGTPHPSSPRGSPSLRVAGGELSPYSLHASSLP